MDGPHSALIWDIISRAGCEMSPINDSYGGRLRCGGASPASSVRRMVATIVISYEWELVG